MARNESDQREVLKSALEAPNAGIFSHIKRNRFSSHVRNVIADVAESRFKNNEPIDELTICDHTGNTLTNREQCLTEMDEIFGTSNSQSAQRKRRG